MNKKLMKARLGRRVKINTLAAAGQIGPTHKAVALMVLDLDEGLDAFCDRAGVSRHLMSNLMEGRPVPIGVIDRVLEAMGHELEIMRIG